MDCEHYEDFEDVEEAEAISALEKHEKASRRPADEMWAYIVMGIALERGFLGQFGHGCLRDA